MSLSSIDTFMDYLQLNEEFHQRFRALAKSPQLGRALEHALASRCAAGRPADDPFSAARVVEILLVAQHQHHALIDAIAGGEGARADAIAQEHARIARQNLDIALDNRQLLEHLPGSTLLRLPPTAVSVGAPDQGTTRSARTGALRCWG